MPTMKTKDGVNLYVKDWGTGRPVIMLHGWPLSSDTFDDLGHAIAKTGMGGVAFSSTDFRPDLATFRVPTLIIHGTGDKTMPIDAAARAAACQITNCTLIEYEGAPHCLFASHKVRLIGDVLGFIANPQPAVPL